MQHFVCLSLWALLKLSMTKQGGVTTHDVPLEDGAVVLVKPVLLSQPVPWPFE